MRPSVPVRRAWSALAGARDARARVPPWRDRAPPPCGTSARRPQRHAVCLRCVCACDMSDRDREICTRVCRNMTKLDSCFTGVMGTTFEQVEDTALANIDAGGRQRQPVTRAPSAKSCRTPRRNCASSSPAFARNSVLTMSSQRPSPSCCDVRYTCNDGVRKAKMCVHSYSTENSCQ